MIASSNHLRAGAALLCVTVLLLSGCGGSDGYSLSAFSGQVLIPGGPAPAGFALQSVSGLVPVPGATLELVRVDEFGSPTGPVLATATSDGNGDYTIDFPDGVTPSADLIVRVSGGPADGLRAQVVSGEVDIDPASEYVLRKLTTDGNTLANVTANEVVALSEVVGEFDIGDAGDIEAAIDNIDTEAADTVDPIVDSVNEAEGDSSDVAGDYHFVEMSVEVTTAPMQVHFVDRGTFSLEDRGSGEGALTDYTAQTMDAELIVSPNGTGGANYTLSVISEPDSNPQEIPFQFAAGGTMTLFQPALEEIEGAFGTREPAAAHTLFPVSSAVDNNTFVSARRFEETEYGLTPGGLIDPSDELGRTVFYTMTLAARQESVSNATLDGAVYGYVGLGQLYEDTGGREVFADLGTLSFTQGDTTTGSVVVSTDIVSLFRAPHQNDLGADVAWGATGPGGVDDPIGEDDGTETLTYQLDPSTGALQITNLPAGEEAEGFVGNGGDLLSLGSTEEVANETENILTMALRLGTANPTVSGNMYRVLAVQQTYGPSGFSAINRLHDSELTVTGTSVSLEIPDRIWQKDNDLASSIEMVGETETETGTLSFDGSNGQATMLIEGTKVTGFFNADGSVGVFRFADSDFGGADQEGTVGLVILIQK